MDQAMRHLWRSVLAQAILDHKKEDTGYFHKDNEDLQEVCMLAGVRVDNAIERAYLIRNGLVEQA